MSDDRLPEVGKGTEYDPTVIKIPPTGGKAFSQIQKDADKVIEKKTAKFIKILAEEISDIQKLLKDYEQDDNASEKLNEVYQRVHNLRGQGTLFDYPLLTEVGGYFCSYINALKEGEKPRKEVMRCFLMAMTLLQKKDIQGEGSAQLKELVQMMSLMVEKLTQSA